MQALIEIPDEALAEIEAISESFHVTRDEILRDAIASYLAQNKSSQNRQARQEAFGLWAGKSGDGVEYQQRIREDRE